MIIVLTQCFPSRIGGIESLVSNLAIGLGKKNKVIVFADRYHFLYDSIYDNQNKDKITIRRTSGLKFFRRRKKIKEAKLFIESTQVELIIADTWKSLELVIDYLNEKNIPTLCLAHGNELLFNDDKKSQRIIKTLNKVNLIIANSQFTVSLVNKLVPNKENVQFVYPGANDLRKLKSDKFINIQGKPVLITLARLEKRKGHKTILKVLRNLIYDLPSIQYIIAGEGSEKTYLKKLVKEYALESNVFFTGLVNDAQKKYLFENADLMVMPTLDESQNRSIEGFGISYIEAALFGIPSIASNVGGTSEAVLHNKTGIVLNHIDELEVNLRELLINQEKIKNLGREAKSRVLNELQWENITNQYLSLISSITEV